MNNEEYLYLDHAATTLMREEAFEAFKKTEIDAYANSSGGHALSRKAKNILEDCRDYIASCFGAAPNEITFTSGGTESDNWIIKSIYSENKSKQGKLVTSKIEHEAVLSSAEWLQSKGYDVEFLSCNKNGVVDLEELKSNWSSNISLVSIMYANNETGVIQPIQEFSKYIKQKDSKVIFHSDVVQAVSTEKLDFHKLGIDSAAISAHKIGGPKGIGVMFISSKFKIPSFFHGGKQELERRAGTVNVSGVAALSAALDVQQRNLEIEKTIINNERNIFEEKLKQSLDVEVVGQNTQRLCHISNIQFKNFNSETLMIAFDLNGLGVSRGSACASGAQKPSHVLVAMNIPQKHINSHLRFSFGWTTKTGDGLRAADKVIKTIKEMN